MLTVMPNMAVERDAQNAAHFGRPSPLRSASHKRHGDERV